MNLPAIIKTPPFPQKLMDAVNAVHDMAGKWPSTNAAITELSRVINATAPLAQWLKAASRTASFEEISRAVGFLVATTSIGNRDGAMFVPALIAYIAEEEPSVYALVEGIKHVGKNDEFISIPRVLKAIEANEERLTRRSQNLAALSTKLAYFQSLPPPPPPPTEEELRQRRQDDRERMRQDWAKHRADEEFKKNYKPRWVPLHSEQAQKMRNSLDREFTDDEWVDYWHTITKSGKKGEAAST